MTLLRTLNAAWVAAALWTVAGEPARALDRPPACGRPGTTTAFLASIGINIHMQQGWQYDDTGATLATLRDLGVTQVRDAFTGLGHPGLEAAARQGFAFDFVINGGWGMGAIPALEAWEKRYPGSILAIEGPNEVNNWPVTYGGAGGISAAQAFQADLYEAVHASPVLSHIPVLALTSWPVFRNKSDIGNIHAYARSGGFATPDIRNAFRDETTINLPRKPVWMTEAGYHTHLGQDPDEGVSEEVQAAMTTALLASAFESGVAKTFLYQLADQYTDPNDEQSHFGLVDRSWRHKPAFAAVKNLKTVLSGGDGPATGAPSRFRLDGMPAQGHCLVLSGARGATLLVLWNEAPIWDRQGDRMITGPAADVTLVLEGTAPRVDVYDPSRGAAAVDTVSGRERIPIGLGNHPLVVRIDAPAREADCLPGEPVR